MPDEIRIPINAKIPKSLHDALMAAVNAQEYTDKTQCITKALEKLLDNTEQDAQLTEEVLREKDDEIQKLQNELRANYAKITELQGIIERLPDPVELAEVRARDDVLHLLIEEKDKRIEGLEREVGNLNGFAHYFKNVEMKAIEAPIEKKKPFWKIW